ncbi:uncharacterized protein LOC141607294 [Silene latifolia]|uniref:uncharacterized protein LOC141607294 n=1 Tax=Silene latifolia TaxID=37657 RepID=UPI003D77E161
MIISSWNVRGFNDPLKLPEALDFIKINNINVIGFVETRVKEKNFISYSKKYFSHYNSTSNHSSQYNGKIWCVWNPSTVDVTIEATAAQYVHCHIKHYASGATFSATFVYEFNDGNLRSDVERIGPNPPAIRDIQDFNECILNSGLNYLPSTGCEFTWTNKQGVHDRVWAKLDRVLVNLCWTTMFPNTSAVIKPPGISDHSPIVVTVFQDIKLPRRFSFLNCWSKHESYPAIVQQAWFSNVQGRPMFQLFTKLKGVKNSLSFLHKHHYTNLTDRIAAVKAQLLSCQYDLQHCPNSEDLINLEAELVNKFRTLKSAELIFLKQTAKIKHIELNDNSTKYFHARVKERKAQQIIGEIVDKNGCLQSGLQKVGKAFVDYYTGLLGTDLPVMHIDPQVIKQGSIIQQQDRAFLTAPVHNEEIRKIVFTMDHDKSPRPDGFSAGFFQSSWSVVELNLCNVVKSFFSSGKMAK